MDRAVLKYLYDIQEAIIKIDAFIGEQKEYANYVANSMLQSAVERQIEIIGEAMNNALRIDSELEITNARKIVNTRNRIIHGYDDIDNIEIWNIIINNLPILKSEVTVLLEATE